MAKFVHCIVQHMQDLLMDFALFIIQMKRGLFVYVFKLHKFPTDDPPTNVLLQQAVNMIMALSWAYVDYDQLHVHVPNSIISRVETYFNQRSGNETSPSCNMTV